ncbi:hypothetical protein ACOMHN_049897 [Nucella lapillus]
MDSDEDICVLQYSDNDEDNHNNDKDITVDAAGTNLFFPFVPISAHTPADNDRDFSSHEALKIAFTTLKQKLNDTKAHNQQLVEKVRELESSKLRVGSDLESFAVIGESFDMMEDVRYAAESGTSTQPTGNMLVGPGEGFPANNNLHRQMAPVSSKTEGGDGRNALYKERSPSTPDKNNQSWSSLSQQVAELRQENGRLQQGWEAERREKDAALHSLRSLQERSCSLQASLSKANQQVSLLNEMRGGEEGERV